jgi:hypothetical protein
VNVLFTLKYTDLCYGYNALWRRCLDVIELPDVAAREPQWGDGFEIETLINVRLAASGAKIAEVPSYEANRIYGTSNLNAVTDGLRVLSTIRREFHSSHNKSKVTAGNRLRQLDSHKPVTASAPTGPSVVYMNSSRHQRHGVRRLNNGVHESELI